MPNLASAEPPLQLQRQPGDILGQLRQFFFQLLTGHRHQILIRIQTEDPSFTFFTFPLSSFLFNIVQRPIELLGIKPRPLIKHRLDHQSKLLRRLFRNRHPAVIWLRLNQPNALRLQGSKFLNTPLEMDLLLADQDDYSDIGHDQHSPIRKS